MERAGLAWPLPIVDAAERVFAAVRAVGWEAADALLDENFEGWEVEFLAHALTVLSDSERIADRRWLAKVLGVLKD